MKNKLKYWKKAILIMYVLCAGILFSQQEVSASVVETVAATAMSTEEALDTILTPLIILKTLIVAVVSTIGVILLVKNLYSLGVSISQQDNSGMAGSLSGAAGGGLMACAGLLIAIFGF